MDTRALVVPALRAAVDTLPNPARRGAAHNFGWATPGGGGAGKMIRPALTLLSAEAAGCRRWAEREADHRLAEALSLLRHALPAPSTTSRLAGLAELVVHRAR